MVILKELSGTMDTDPYTEPVKKSLRVIIPDNKKGQSNSIFHGRVKNVINLEPVAADARSVHMGREVKSKSANKAMREALEESVKKKEEKPEKNSHIITTFGRFNPPHVGHEALINKMAELALHDKKGAHVEVHLSKSEDSKKNPIPYSTKFELAKKAFGNCVKHSEDVKDIIGLAQYYNGKYDHLTVAGGEDNATSFKGILKYNGPEEGKLYNYKKIDFLTVPRLHASTRMREQAKAGDLKSFTNALPAGLRANGKEIMGHVVKGMTEKKKPLKEAVITPKIKEKLRINDFYTLIRPHGVEKDPHIQAKAIKIKGKLHVGENPHEHHTDILTRVVGREQSSKIQGNPEKHGYERGFISRLDNNYHNDKDMETHILTHVKKYGMPASYPSNEEVSDSILLQMLENEFDRQDGLWELTPKAKENLAVKAIEAGLDLSILEEIYREGYLEQADKFTSLTPEQFGFLRVNQFLKEGGKNTAQEIGNKSFNKKADDEHLALKYKGRLFIGNDPNETHADIGERAFGRDLYMKKPHSIWNDPDPESVVHGFIRKKDNRFQPFFEEIKYHKCKCPNCHCEKDCKCLNGDNHYGAFCDKCQEYFTKEINEGVISKIKHSGFRWHKTIHIMPGVHINLSKKGVGASVGGKNFRHSFGLIGQGHPKRTSFHIPGTKITYYKRHKTPAQKAEAKAKKANKKVNEEIRRVGHGTGTQRFLGFKEKFKDWVTCEHKCPHCMGTAGVKSSKGKLKPETGTWSHKVAPPPHKCPYPAISDIGCEHCTQIPYMTAKVWKKGDPVNESLSTPKTNYPKSEYHEDPMKKCTYCGKEFEKDEKPTGFGARSEHPICAKCFKPNVDIDFTTFMKHDNPLFNKGKLKEDHGAGFIGTSTLTDNYKKDTPGQNTPTAKNHYIEDKYVEKRKKANKVMEAL